MKTVYPEYYETFQCIASACPDSCCKEWEVDVDEASAAYYRALPGALGDTLRKALKDTEGGTSMTISDGRCPMWRQDGLCRIQAELGHDALCATCREFPRLRHDYGDFVELGLELSCPEAARLILSSSEKMIAHYTEGGEAPEYDPELMQILLQSRETVLGYLATSQQPVCRKLAVVLLYGHHVQAWLDGGEEAKLEEADALALLEQIPKGDWGSLLSLFRDMQILTQRWKQRLDRPDGGKPEGNGYEKLMRYFIQRHWLQAVSDYDLIGRVKFMIAACLLIGYLGGEIIQTAQLFSKEIENDRENLEAVFDGAYTAPALTDMNLLGLLKVDE